MLAKVKSTAKVAASKQNKTGLMETTSPVRRQLEYVSQCSTQEQKVIVVEVAFHAHALDGIVDF